ncbi:hypothetical protein OWR29_44715 [Actinoplanes sp. Pm04-4]|uniref:Uncharacterized protein n=1 Tax=Paractinoplanes pyxinae TaxID=2997416 RepID=A0ABT4BF39_9ACTN|nr:hypothetical protein [Actinoplanes pyxinae]MCY1145148.1 hypothetical protein [Actinoplanes pyxinae]
MTRSMTPARTGTSWSLVLQLGGGGGFVGPVVNIGNDQCPEIHILLSVDGEGALIWAKLLA